MKKLIIKTIVVILAIVAIVSVYCYRAGVQHAMYDSEIDVHENIVYINLDGDVYTHFVIQERGGIPLSFFILTENPWRREVTPWITGTPSSGFRITPTTSSG